MLVNERVSCIHVWRIPFSVVPIYRTVNHKIKSCSDGSSLVRKNLKCSFVKCTRVISNFSLMFSILLHACIGIYVKYVKFERHAWPYPPCTPCINCLLIYKMPYPSYRFDDVKLLESGNPVSYTSS